jgi:triosephosphate isomerase
MPRRPLIAGNWKMNGNAEDGARWANALLGLIGGAETGFDMMVAPPFTLIGGIADILAGSGIDVGGQDCHSDASGAHTGEISAPMLADLGCRYVIVGHSERRADNGETDDLVKSKAGAGLDAGLTAVVCIGETEAERDEGKTRQLGRSLPSAADGANTVIAYEPVWAIGTGRTPTAEEVRDVHGFIRARLADSLGGDEAGRLRILYGGSMKPGNAAELLGLADVDGGLIGGASLAAEDFWAIGQGLPLAISSVPD